MTEPTESRKEQLSYKGHLMRLSQHEGGWTIEIVARTPDGAVCHAQGHSLARALNEALRTIDELVRLQS